MIPCAILLSANSHVVLELEHVLHQVVSVGVLNQVVYPADDHIGQRQLLGCETLLKAALHHAAPVLVRADLVTVGHAGTEDELRVRGKGLCPGTVTLLGLVRRFERKQEGLDHMVTIRVRRQVEDVLGHLCTHR